MKNGLKVFVFVLTSISLSACLSQLKTREDLKGQTEVSQPPAEVVVEAGSESAPPIPAFKQEERNAQIRALYGRVEEAENQVQELRQAIIDLAESRQLEKQESAKTLQAYEEAIKEMEAQIQALKGNPDKASSNKSAQEEVKPKKDPAADYRRGEGLADQKKWKEAIVAYQKYREAHPKGKFYPEATFKMGQCFLELGMKDESKSFFEEVRVKFPKSPLAKRAEKQLKSL